MGTVYKETYTQRLPADAGLITRKGERLARWKDRNGRRRTAPAALYTESPGKGRALGFLDRTGSVRSDSCTTVG